MTSWQWLNESNYATNRVIGDGFVDLFILEFGVGFKILLGPKEIFRRGQT